MNTLTCDVAILGGGMGGMAAARIAQSGLKVVVTEATDWVGGQMTAQGVSALDEHAYIETFGGTASYMALRERIRQHYPENFNVPTVHGGNVPLNPGNGWVSRLCFEPRVGLKCLLQDEAYETVTFLLNTIPVRAEVVGRSIQYVIVRHLDGTETKIVAPYFLDATELGDLLPLAGLAYITGAESRNDTGEAFAPDAAHPGEVQSFTCCFAVEYCPGENHVIAKPEGYESFRESQPYSLVLRDKAGNPLYFDMFRVSEQGKLPFWTYRRIYDGSLLGGNDLALINWHGNDYYGISLIDAAPEEQAKTLEEAKRLSLGFLYWLQTECPRDDGGCGYPEFKLRPDVMDSADGMGKFPYIREARRIKAVRRILAQDISAENHTGARAGHFSDSVGLGWYAMDLHPCVGNPTVSMYAPTRPFQIPLGALIPHDCDNLIAACKNIGTTHLTNGAYRLHPVEWNIGESAGITAAFCIENNCHPHAVLADESLLLRLQTRLVQQGIPIFWAVDVPQVHPLFTMTQRLLVQDLLVPHGTRWNQLEIQPEAPLRDDVELAKLQAAAVECGITEVFTSSHTWEEVCRRFAQAV